MHRAAAGPKSKEAGNAHADQVADFGCRGVADVVDAFIVVDMQLGMLRGTQIYDLDRIVDRINSLSLKVKSEGGKIIWIRHCGSSSDGFEPRTSGWEFLPELVRGAEDLVIEKTRNDPYAETPLAEALTRMQPGRVLVAGWATDICVDATVRSTIRQDHHVVAVGDAHTVSDRPHLGALAIIAHHNWLWQGLVTNRSVRVAKTLDLLSEKIS